jgi:hypothetical protein
MNATNVSCTTDADCRIHPTNTQADCILAPLDGPPAPGTCYARKMKYISTAANPDNAGRPTARRIKLVSMRRCGGGSANGRPCLDNACPGGGTCMEYVAPGGGTVIGWMGPIVQTAADGSTLHRVQSTPAYGMWDDTAVTRHIGDCEIQPNTVYAIAAVVSGADTADESNYSESLILRTAVKWGDAMGGQTLGASNPGNNSASIEDTLATIQVFSGGAVTPRSWVDMEGSPANTPNYNTISIADTLRNINAFSGAPYPFSSCPGVPNAIGGCTVNDLSSGMPAPCP